MSESSSLLAAPFDVDTAGRVPELAEKAASFRSEPAWLVESPDVPEPFLVAESIGHAAQDSDAGSFLTSVRDGVGTIVTPTSDGDLEVLGNCREGLTASLRDFAGFVEELEETPSGSSAHFETLARVSADPEPELATYVEARSAPVTSTTAIVMPYDRILHDMPVPPEGVRSIEVTMAVEAGDGEGIVCLRVSAGWNPCATQVMLTDRDPSFSSVFVVDGEPIELWLADTGGDIGEAEARGTTGPIDPSWTKVAISGSLDAPLIEPVL